MARAKRATYADIERLPEHLVGEIVDGELWVSPRPAGPHTLAASALLGALPRFATGKRAWWVLFEPELHRGSDVLVPNVAGWRRQRMPEGPVAKFFTLPPDWICEVLSPSSAYLDVERKLPKYARAGVRHAWIVDPQNRK